MAKILISCVGNRDPYAEETTTEGPILTAARFFTPEYIYLLPTAQRIGVSNTYRNAEETKKELEDIFPESEVFIKSLDVRDPTDYNQVRAEIRRNLENIYGEWSNEDNQYNNVVSSGTPQMQAVWLLLKDIGFLRGSMHRVIEPKFAKSDKPADRVLAVNAEFLEEDRILKRTIKFLDSYSFEYAASEMQRLAEITVRERREIYGKNFYTIFHAYALWDHLEFNHAFDQLAAALKNLNKYNGYKQIGDLLEKQKNVLENLKNARMEDLPVLTDIYFNLQRRYLRKNYSDALARLWRLYEGFAFYIMREKYKIEPNDLKSSENKDLADQLINRFGIKGYGRKRIFTINRDTIIKYLQKERNPIYEKMKTNTVKITSISGTSQNTTIEKALENLRLSRNNSIVAHGIKPVPEYVARQCVEVGKELLCLWLDGNTRALEEAPFNPKFVNSFIDFLAQN